jgi:YggT family protein
MYAWNQLVLFIAEMLEQLIGIYVWIVIVAALLSWVQPNPYNPVVRALSALTEPAFDWVREHLPVVLGGLDLSPIVVLIGLQFLQRYLIPVLERLLIVGVA